MGFRLPVVAQARKILRHSPLIAGQSATKAAADVPKGYLAVYVGEEENKRFVIPISYLKHPSFQDLLSQAEEEFGFDHTMGGLTIPCSKYSLILLAVCRPHWR